MTEKEQKIFDMQSPSYKAAMAQSEDERKAHRLSAIVSNAQCLKEDGSVDLNIREISLEQEQAYLQFRRERGPAIEETRTAYLKANLHKIHPKLHSSIETPYVIPPAERKERAIKGYMGGFTVKAIKEKFTEIMKSLFKPTHAEVVAGELRKMREEKE